MAINLAQRKIRHTDTVYDTAMRTTTRSAGWKESKGEAAIGERGVRSARSCGKFMRTGNPQQYWKSAWLLGNSRSTRMWQLSEYIANNPTDSRGDERRTKGLEKGVADRRKTNFAGFRRTSSAPTLFASIAKLRGCIHSLKFYERSWPKKQEYGEAGSIGGRGERDEKIRVIIAACRYDGGCTVRKGAF